LACQIFYREFFCDNKIKIRGFSASPVRRFTVTQNLKDPTWDVLNSKDCGYRYELNAREKLSMPQDVFNAANSNSNKFMGKG